MENKQIVFFATVTAGIMVSVGLAAAAVSNVLEDGKASGPDAATQIIDPATVAPAPSLAPVELPELPQVTAPTIPATPAVSRGDAVNAVRSASNGSLVNAEKVTINGADFWAVTVKKTDGSKLVGYVDGETGGIVEWAVLAPPTVKVIKAAPAPAAEQPQATNYENESSDDDDDDDEEHEEHEGDDDDD